MSQSDRLHHTVSSEDLPSCMLHLQLYLSQPLEAIHTELLADYFLFLPVRNVQVVPCFYCLA